MAGDVAKRLLSNPVQTKGHGPGRLVDVARSSEARWNSVHGAKSRALGLQRLDQSQVLENSGMKRIGQCVHVLAQLDQVATYRTHRLASRRVAKPFFLPSRIDRKQSQALGDVIVERVRQSCALILMRGDQVSAEIASFVFSVPAFGDVDRYGAQLPGLAVRIEFDPPPRGDPTRGRIPRRHSIFRFVFAVAFDRSADRLAQQLAIVWMHSVDEPIKMDGRRRVPVSRTPVARARPDLVLWNVPNPEAQLGRERRQAHTFFACPQSVIRSPQPQPVEQQTNDQDRLKRGEARGGKDIPPVLLPKRRLAEPDRAAGWKIGLSHSPSSQLPPVELRFFKSLWRGLDIAGRGSPKDLRGDLGGLAAQGADGEQRPSNNTGPQLIVVLSEYWRVGYGVQPGENLLLATRNALRVDDEIAEKDRGGGRQGRDALLDFGERKVIHENGLDPTLKRVERVNIFVGPEFFDRRIADHNCERRCVRQRSEDVSKNCVQVSRKRDHRLVGGERRVFDRSGVKGGEKDGPGGKEVSSVALDEARSGTYQCNDQIGRMGRKKGSQIAHEGVVPLAVGKA